MTTQNRAEQGFSKITQSELGKLTREEMTPFVAASVGRLSNLHPHWMLLRVETPLGIPSSRLIVLWMLSSRESMSMGDIATAIDLTPRGVTRIVDGLESEGLARRVVSESDRRVKTVKLTAKGRRFVGSALPMALREFSHLFSVLDRQEALEFVRVLEKLTDRMKSEIDRS